MYSGVFCSPLPEESRHRNALFNASIMKSTGGKTRGSPKIFEFNVKSVQLVLRGTDVHSCDILIRYYWILGASSEYPATVFKHSELILFCHSALQDVHLRESKLRG